MHYLVTGGAGFIGSHLVEALLARGDAVFLPDALSRVRRHAGQWSNANMLSGRVMTDKRALFRDFVSRLEPSLSVGQKLQWDARMASSIERTRLANGQQTTKVEEIFHPFAFRIFRRIACAVHTAGAFVSGQRS